MNEKTKRLAGVFRKTGMHNKMVCRMKQLYTLFFVLSFFMLYGVKIQCMDHNNFSITLVNSCKLNGLKEVQKYLPQLFHLDRLDSDIGKAYKDPDEEYAKNDIVDINAITDAVKKCLEKNKQILDLKFVNNPNGQETAFDTIKKNAQKKTFKNGLISVLCFFGCVTCLYSDKEWRGGLCYIFCYCGLIFLRRANRDMDKITDLKLKHVLNKKRKKYEEIETLLNKGKQDIELKYPTTSS